MSKPAFTPGPWKDVATSRSGSGQWHEIKSGQVVIAEVFDDNTNDGSYPDAAAQAANASLIAAAPELYEAVRLFVEEYDGNDDQTGVGMMLAYNRALEAGRAAIAKACGEGVPA